jgi:hypothetical protein
MAAAVVNERNVIVGLNDWATIMLGRAWWLVALAIKPPDSV